MVQAFIKKRGVTACPSFGTPEFREMNIAREKERADSLSLAAKQKWQRRASPRKAATA
jgi:hypothetical protein